MSKTMTVLVAVLVALLAVAATGVGAYATGQGSRMSDDEVAMTAQQAEDGAKRLAEIHTNRLLDDQEDAHAKELREARKAAHERGYDRGYETGNETGYTEGNEAGYSSGYGAGNSAGVEQGKEEASDELTCSDDSDVDLPACDWSYLYGYDY